jgi:hypothetical protein
MFLVLKFKKRLGSLILETGSHIIEMPWTLGINTVIFGGVGGKR